MTVTETLSRLRKCRVVPVLTIEDASIAIDLAKAFLAGGIDVLEVTLRTDAGIQVIERIKQSGLNCLVGAGTVTTSDDVKNCQIAGADFLVSPATPRELIDPLLNYDGAALPGAATPTEALTLSRQGFNCIKFFPAEAAGGVKMLKALAAPLPTIEFMPTGGITAESAETYLSLPNVVAIGGSWLCNDQDLNERAWEKVTNKARRVQEIRPQSFGQQPLHSPKCT